jgi:hypothetical protein
MQNMYATQLLSSQSLTCSKHAGKWHRQEGADLPGFIACLAVQPRAALQVQKQECT